MGVVVGTTVAFVGDLVGALVGDLVVGALVGDLVVGCFVGGVGTRFAACNHI